MAQVGAVFVAAGLLLLLVALVLGVAWALVRQRMRHWRRTGTRTTGAISKLPRHTASPRLVEVTYLDPQGHPHVVRQRWSAALADRPSVGVPVTVWHRPDAPDVAAVDSPGLGAPVTARGLRAGAWLVAVPGALAVLVGIGLRLVARWGQLG